MPNPSQEPPVSSKAPNEDLKDMDVLCTFKIKIESHNLDHGCIKDQCPYANQDQDASRNIQHPLKPPIRTQRIWMFFAHSKSKLRAKILIIAISKTSDHIQIKIEMPNPSQEPPSSSKNKDLKDMVVLCIFKIKVESQNLEQGTIKDHDYL